MFLASLACFADLDGQEPTRHRLVTSDGVELPAYVYETDPAGADWVLLFHQGGASGRAEYAPIVPRIREMGLNVLVIDQRRGGELFDGRNEVAARFDPDTTSYCDVAPDLESALDFALGRAPGRRVVLWGSSYSAALALRLAARRPDDVSAVLAFSPASGAPMERCEPEPVLGRIRAPVLVVRPASEMEYGWIADQLAHFEATGATTWVASPGRHGSSTLVESRVGSSTQDSWAVVVRFLSDALAMAPRTP